MAVRTVVRHEMRMLRSDRGLLVALAVFAALFLYAVANGAAWVRFQERTADAVRVAAEERATDLAEELRAIAAGAEPASPWRDPRAPNVLGGARGAHPAVLEPGPLAALAVGQSDLLPYYYDVSIYTNEQSFLQNGEVENPLNLMVGRFDLAFVIVYLLPLLVLALGYNVLSAEREQGTLGLTLSQPVSARRVVTARTLFRAALVLGMALGASLLGALATGGMEAPGRLALWSVAVVAYALFWFGLAVWINTLARSSAWNATALVGAWLALVVVLPATLNIVAGVLHPLPSRVEMITAQREASNEAVNRRSELLARYLEDHPEMAGGVVGDAANSAALSWAATEEVNRRLEEVAARYEERLAGQRGIMRRYRFLSPALLAQETLNDAAGTGDARFERFEAQVRAFATEWKAFFVPAILSGRQMSADVVADLPRFRPVEESAAEVAARTAPPLLALFLALGLVGVPAWLGLGRVRGGA